MTLASLAAGLAFGVLAAQRGGVLRAAVNLVEPLGALWVNAIRMTLVPLVVALLVTSVTSFANVRARLRRRARPGEPDPRGSGRHDDGERPAA